jgi:hypothetical protein
METFELTNKEEHQFMKKNIEISKDERDVKIEALESRLEAISPRPKIETLEPYEIGATVYSIADGEATVGLVVAGYRSGRILIIAADDPEPRAWPIDSVRRSEDCPGVKSDRIGSRIDDPTAAQFFEGRRAARAAALTPPVAPPRPEPKYRWAD